MAPLCFLVLNAFLFFCPFDPPSLGVFPEGEEGTSPQFIAPVAEVELFLWLILPQWKEVRYKLLPDPVGLRGSFHRDTPETAWTWGQPLRHGLVLSPSVSPLHFLATIIDGPQRAVCFNS